MVVKKAGRARPERLELDRRRAARALAAGAVDAGAADAADRAFLRLMLRLLAAVRARPRYFRLVVHQGCSGGRCCCSAACPLAAGPQRLHGTRSRVVKDHARARRRTTRR